MNLYRLIIYKYIYIIQLKRLRVLKLIITFAPDTWNNHIS